MSNVIIKLSEDLSRLNIRFESKPKLGQLQLELRLNEIDNCNFYCEPNLILTLTASLRKLGFTPLFDKRTREFGIWFKEITNRGITLYSHQITGISYLKERKAACLFDSPGLGKSAQSLLSSTNKILVICPNLAKGVFAREIKLWRPDITKTTILKGLKSFRWPEENEMVILNYEIQPVSKKELNAATKELKDLNKKNETKLRGERKAKLQKLIDQYMEIGDCPENLTLIADECHRLKDSKTLQTIRFREICNSVQKNNGRTYGLSGTPLQNTPLDLWHVLHSFNLAKIVFGEPWVKPAKTAYDNFLKIFKAKRCPWGGYWFGKVDKEIIVPRLRKVSIRREIADVIDNFPDKIYKIIDIELDEDVLRVCDQFIEEYGEDYLEKIVEKIINGEEGVGIEFEKLTEARKLLASAKIPAMLEFIEDFEDRNEPLIVASAHRIPIDMLENRAGWKVITGDVTPKKRTEIEDSFQKGELKGIGLTIQAGGMAITLTHARNMLFVDRDWRSIMNNQCEARIHRIGQKDLVIITRIEANHQIDRNVGKINKRKENIINNTINASKIDY